MVRLLEFVFFITVAAIGSAALFMLVGRSAWVLLLLGGVAAAFTWGSPGDGAVGEAHDADSDDEESG